jgi:hypothetical protein
MVFCKRAKASWSAVVSTTQKIRGKTKCYTNGRKLEIRSRFAARLAAADAGERAIEGVFVGV